jgi:hypothetical protein
LNARYLLDGDQPGLALKAYATALRLNPGFALQHWHRMIYAALCLVGGKGMARWYFRLRPDRRPDLKALIGDQPWPGLHQDVIETAKDALSSSK